MDQICSAFPLARNSGSVTTIVGMAIKVGRLLLLDSSSFKDRLKMEIELKFLERD